MWGKYCLYSMCCGSVDTHVTTVPWIITQLCGHDSFRVPMRFETTPCYGISWCYKTILCSWLFQIRCKCLPFIPYDSTLEFCSYLGYLSLFWRLLFKISLNIINLDWAQQTKFILSNLLKPFPNSSWGIKQVAFLTIQVHSSIIIHFLLNFK